MRILAHHIYEYEKGLRNLVLHTLPALMEAAALEKLCRRHIAFHSERVGSTKVNIFFGDPDCVAIVKCICQKPLSALSAEEDFILGTMLGYGRLVQCRRYLQRREMRAAV